MSTQTNATTATEADKTDNFSVHVDNVTPTLTTINIFSNNNTKTNYAGENDIVTLDITATETINQPNVVFKSNGDDINNTTITYTPVDNAYSRWTAQYTVSSSDANGPITFTVNVSDNAGNIAQEATATTNSSSVTKVGNINVIASQTSTTNGLQLGNNISGIEVDEHAFRCALNRDGNIVAVGSSRYNSLAGRVRIYQRDTTNDSVEPHGWTQLGSDIVGSTDDTLGGSVSLNSNGNIIVIGGSGSANDTGVVKVYQRDTTEPIGWRQLGNNIFGDEADDHLGSHVSINSDGTIIAVAATDGGTNGTGYVKVYQRDTGATLGWSQLGNNIVGHQYSSTSSTVCSCLLYTSPSPRDED